MRIAALVNGPPHKTNAVRVRELFRDLAQRHTVTYLYREDERRLASARRFCRDAVATRPDVVWVEGMGYTGILGGLAAKAAIRSRFILSTGDAAYAFARANMGAAKAQVVRAMELTALRVSDAIVVWGPYHKTLLEGQGYRNVHWIPGGVDTTLFRPMDVHDLRARLGLDGALSIGVVGSINWNRRLEYSYGRDLLEVLRLLPDAPVKGVVVGEGDGVPFLRTLAERYGLGDRVVFAGWVDHEELPRYVNAMDVCLSTQSNDLVGEVRVTAKVPEYLACGRYVIASAVGGAKEFVAGCGRVIPCTGVLDPAYLAGVADEIKRILADRTILERGRAGVAVAEGVFDYVTLRRKLTEVLATVDGHHEGGSAR